MADHEHHHHEHAEHHIAPTSMYWTIFAILMGCTGLTYFVWTINLGPFNFVVAIAIAIFKATLVVLYFMHVKWSQVLSKLSVVAAVVFLGILLILTGSDYGSRDWTPRQQGWESHPTTR